MAPILVIFLKEVRLKPDQPDRWAVATPLCDLACRDMMYDIIYHFVL